ncbi:MAG TPA: RDD family protein [Pirellulaceae bacterium]|nr:RDD family protein [Pirellulaceae bacterium]
MPAKNEPLDATIDIVTPENIAFHYRIAGPFRRLPALLLDYFLRIAFFALLWFLYIIISILTLMLVPQLRTFFSTIAAGGVALLVVLWFVTDWFYGGFFETVWNGQTPGKRLLGIRVVTTSGQPINGLQAVLRNVLRYADLMPLLSLQIFNPLLDRDVAEGGLPALNVFPTLLFGLFAMLLTKRYQRLGDLVCGTMVILEEKSWLSGVAKLEDPRAPQLAAYLPNDFVVSRTLARTLAMYVDRRRFFTDARRRDIAKHLADPLLRLFGLPLDTSHDLLLCALYYRTFIADRGDNARPLRLTEN